MGYELQKRILSNFNSVSFEAFIKYLLSEEYKDGELPFGEIPQFDLPHYIHYYRGSIFSFYEHLFLINHYCFNQHQFLGENPKILSIALKNCFSQVQARYPIERGPYDCDIYLGN